MGRASSRMELVRERPSSALKERRMTEALRASARVGKDAEHPCNAGMKHKIDFIVHGLKLPVKGWFLRARQDEKRNVGQK